MKVCAEMTSLGCKCRDQEREVEGRDAGESP